MTRTKSTSPFEGRWRITSMDMWGQDFVDAEVEGYFQFEANGRGQFQFGYVSGDMDYETSDRGGKPWAEWTWDGNDEMDPASGRGWALLDGDELHGLIAIHHGDKSAFVAKKISDKSKRKKK